MAQLPVPIVSTVRSAPELPDAACAGRDPLFDAEIHNETADDRKYRLARATAICGQCPATSACRDIADQLDPPPAGVWAGEVRNPSKPRAA